MNKLSEIAEINMGQSPSSDSYNQEKEGLPFFQGKADFGEIYPTARIWCNNPIKIAEKDDILMSVRAPVGNLNIVNEKCCIGRGLVGIKAIKSKCYYKYLYYFLKSKYNELNQKSTGSTFKSINKENILSIQGNIHTKIEDQVSIADKLDKVQEILDIRKKQIGELEELIKSQFVELFGDIENTKYEVYKLSELTNLITDGEHKKPKYTENGIPFISVVNITTGDLKFENCKFVSEEDACKFNKRCNPKKDDILYTKVGATYGRSAIVNTDKKFALYVSVCLIKPKKDLINPIFLNYTMKQPYVKSQADKCIKGIGVPDLHLIEIKNFKIILPSIEEQNQFANFVKQIDKQKFKIQKSLEEIQQLQENLMNQYFG